MVLFEAIGRAVAMPMNGTIFRIEEIESRRPDIVVVWGFPGGILDITVRGRGGVLKELES